VKQATVIYEAKAELLGEETIRRVERDLVLQFTDSLWKDHLLAMDRLRQGVSLRGYGQRNPLLEYKKEGFSMFMYMNALRDEQVIQRIRTITPEELQAVGLGTKRGAQQLSSGDVSRPRQPAPLPDTPDAAAAPPQRPPKGPQAHAFALVRRLSRNEPCPCGSGKKLKKCCMKVALPVALKEQVDKILTSQDDALARAKADAEAKLEAMKAEAASAAQDGEDASAASEPGAGDGGEQPGA
jgi:preprotein translocase subunit SecA